MADSELLRLAQEFKDALERQDEAALNRIANAYSRIYRQLEAQVDALVTELATVENLSSAKLYRLARFQSLMRDIEKEIVRFQEYLRTEILSAAELSFTTGNKQAMRLMEELLAENGITAQLGKLPAGSFEAMVAFLQDNSPLWKRIQELAGQTALYVREALLDGIALGYNPRKVARMIQEGFGRGLTDALRMTRTAQLWAHREATRANYMNNADVIDGWVWFATLDETVCASCVAQHGTIHPLDETLNDHHNGRCVPLPYIEAFGNPVTETGQEWFEKQPEAVQKTLLGKGKYEAWKDNKFSFSQLSREVENDVYGLMRTETPLKDLVKDAD